MAASTTPNLKDEQLIKNILENYASIPYAHGDLTSQVIIDSDSRRFMLLTSGWDGLYRVHSILVDVELRGDKFWIHRDGTEDGVATDLEEAGIPKSRIVLGWFPEKERQLTDYAVH